MTEHFGIVLALVIFNVYISARVIGSFELDASEKRNQFLLLWFVPILGGLIVLAALYGSVEDIRTSEEVRAQRRRYRVQWVMVIALMAASVYSGEVFARRHAAAERAKLETQAWERARSSDRPEPLVEYLTEFPDGGHRCEAACIVARAGHKRASIAAARTECRADRAALQELARLLDEYDQREQRSYLEAIADGSADRLEAHVDRFPDGLHSDDARSRADALRDLEAGFDVSQVSLRPEAYSTVPRKGVVIAFIDEGTHLQIVSEAARNVFSGQMAQLALNRPLARNLAEIANWKARNPGYDIVVNMSWRYSRPNRFDAYLFDLLAKTGVVFVAAAGNEGEARIPYPAAYAPVIGVGATRPDGILTEYSNTGDELDVCLVDRSEDAEAEMIKSVFEKLGTPECRDVAELYWPVIRDKKRFLQAAMRFLEEEKDRQHIASGTSLAAGAFSGYIARQIADHPSTPIDEIVAPYRRQPGQTFVKLPVSFGAGPQSNERIAQLLRMRSGGGCRELTGILQKMRTY